MKPPINEDTLLEFIEPIQSALWRYSQISDGDVMFDYDNAALLEFTPDKPNTARTQTVVEHLGKTAGILTIVAFAPGNATGDVNTYTLDQIDTGRYRNEPKYVPRSKAAFDTESHLTIASKNLFTNAAPVMYTGSLDVLGLVGGRRDEKPFVAEVGFVGQTAGSLSSALDRTAPAKPRVTLTTGYKGSLTDRPEQGKRFGDPHAMLNGTTYSLQVCGFLAITPEAAAEHREMFLALKARYPEFVH
jgi:hypothetical protein